MQHSIQTKCPPRRLTAFVCALALLSGCVEPGYTSPEGYDLSKGELNELGKDLNEISGIAYDSTTGHLVGVADSKRQIFSIDFTTPKLEDLTDKVVGADQDLEDVAVTDSNIYLLASRGVIYEIPKANAKNVDSAKAYTIPLEGTNDFETLYYDPQAGGLIMLCKSCVFEKARRSAFRFDLKTKQFDTAAYYVIPTEDVKSLLKDSDAKFDPSAAAIHPLNKRLYILSSAGNLLVVADTRGKVIEAFRLNPDKYPQAEGIAFSPRGDLFITNEGKYGKPTLQIFHPKEKK